MDIKMLYTYLECLNDRSSYAKEQSNNNLERQNQLYLLTCIAYMLTMS